MLWILFQNNTKKNNAKAGKFKTNSLFALLLFVLSIILNEVVHVNYPSPKGKGLVKAQID